MKKVNSMFFINMSQTYNGSSTSPKIFEKLPGTGLIVNFLAMSMSQQASFYIPAVTYGCPHNTWNAHCTDIDIMRRSICVFLVVFSVVMVVNVLMPQIVESIMCGILIGGFASYAFVVRAEHDMDGRSEMNTFVIFFVGGSFTAFVFGVLSLYIQLGRYMTKLIFSCLIVVFFLETCSSCNASIYIFIVSALLVSIGFAFVKISFSVLLGGLLMIISLSRILKVGNLHRIFENNFLSMTLPVDNNNNSMFSFTREKFINYRVEFNVLDYALAAFYFVVATLLTLRKEILLEEMQYYDDIENVEEYNLNIARQRRQAGIVGLRRRSTRSQLRIVSRCRRHHYRSNVIHERSPLISHWLESSETEDDEVFVSPESNTRFMQSLSDVKRHIVEDIQKF